MSLAEVDRVSVMEGLVAGRLRQREAADRLGLSVLQVRRLLRRYRLDGSSGLISKRRGRRPSNRRLPAAVRESALALIRDRYADFGPTLAAETLAERHALTVSRETLRRWMIEDGLWRPKAARAAGVHPRRERRPRLGELVQIDGSPHDWFEGRAPRATLILFVDDATSRLMAGGFFEAETTAAYMTVMHDYLDRHGRPLAVYSDRHGIFQVNRAGAEHRVTQFGRATVLVATTGRTPSAASPRVGVHPPSPTTRRSTPGWTRPAAGGKRPPDRQATTPGARPPPSPPNAPRPAADRHAGNAPRLASARPEAVDLWTSPSERRASCGTHGQPVDNARTRCPPPAHTRAPLAHNPTASTTTPRKPGHRNDGKPGHDPTDQTGPKGTLLLCTKGDISILR